MADSPPPGGSPTPAPIIYVAAVPTDGRAVAALVLGLISPFGALFYGVPGLVMGLSAVVLGFSARSRIKKSGGTRTGSGIALAGMIVGIVGIVVGLALGTAPVRAAHGCEHDSQLFDAGAAIKTGPLQLPNCQLLTDLASIDEARTMSAGSDAVGVTKGGLWMTHRRLGLFLPVAAAVVALFVQSFGVSADLNPPPVDNSRNALNAPAPDSAAQFGSAPKVKPGVAFCVSAPTSDANANTDCKQNTVGPHNETSIAVDPTNAMHMVGGANDYQLSLNPDGHVAETILSQAHVTMDGGKSWANYPVFSDASYQATGDPAIAFDGDGNVYYATLGFRFVSFKTAQNPDVLVSHSTDGGKSWDVVRVAAGSGIETQNGTLLDKEYITAWGSGNVLVTYGNFQIGDKGNIIGSDVFAQVSHDGGNSWSAAQLLSGGLNHQAFVATPVRAADGSIFASFLNTTDTASGRDDYEVQKIDPNTGAALFAKPVKVATTIDGFKDSPFFNGRETYQDSVFRSWAAGNIAADPKNASHLVVVWSDWRNSPPPDPTLNPYKSVTNADIIVSESTDGGASWSSATAISRNGDQFQPWTVFDTNGNLRIGFFDRSYDSNNHMYGYTVATETSGIFSFQQVTTTLSDPTKNDRWFSGGPPPFPGFPHPTRFLGDYSGIAATADGHVVAYWCDMRNTINFAGRMGSSEDAYFGRAN